MNDKDNVMDAAIEYCSGNKGADARVRAGFVMGAHWQKEKNIKTFKNVYADLLSAQGYDVGSINSEINRLERIIKEGE